MSRIITKEEINLHFPKSEEEVTRDKLVELFTFKYDPRNKNNSPVLPKFNPNDTFTIDPDFLPNNKIKQETTVGRYIFNLFIVSPCSLNQIEYINKEMDAKVLKDLEATLSNLLFNDKISTKDFAKYLDRIQWLGYTLSDMLSASISHELLIPTNNILKRRKELADQYREEIANGDVITAAKIEKELLEIAEKDLEGLDSLEIYKSGSKCSFKNDFKNTVIMEDPVKDFANDSFFINIKSLAEGEINDLPKRGTNLASGSYHRAVGTQKGGYITKQFQSAFQSTVLDKEGSDCQTTKTLKVKILKDNSKLFLFRYIVEGNKLVLLTPENISNYIDKEVNLRSPMFCLGKNICSVCAGQLLYKLGITNAGLATTTLSSAILNASMKQFHDATIKVGRINFKEYIK